MAQSCVERRSVAAVATALGLVLASGAGYRALAWHLARPSDSQAIPPGTLARLPLKMNGWVGRDVPLDKAVVRQTSTDDHINRLYAQEGGTGAVSLFVAYGIRARDLMPHRPEVCYPGAGWTLDGAHDMQVPLADQSRLDCRLYRFVRGGLNSEGVTVLNYYIVDGEYCPDVSLVRTKAWRGSGGVRYMAQVQIVCGHGALGSAEAAADTAKAFATECAPRIRALLPDASSLASPVESRGVPGTTHG